MISLLLIGIYQKTLSPDHGVFKHFFPYGYCRFYPSCSEYAKHSLIFHGIWKGAWWSANRIFRCHPWSRGGIDFPHI